MWLCSVVRQSHRNNPVYRVRSLLVNDSNTSGLSQSGTSNRVGKKMKPLHVKVQGRRLLNLKMYNL